VIIIWNLPIYSDFRYVPLHILQILQILYSAHIMFHSTDSQFMLNLILLIPRLCTVQIYSKIYVHNSKYNLLWKRTVPFSIFSVFVQFNSMHSPNKLFHYTYREKASQNIWEHFFRQLHIVQRSSASSNGVSWTTRPKTNRKKFLYWSTVAWQKKCLRIFWLFAKWT
jgi:hypothetical protein